MVDDSSAGSEDDAMADTQHLNRMLLEAFRAIDAQVDAALEARGVKDLSPRHATAILLVEKKGVRLTGMAERAGITKQAMMQVVNDLERLGLVKRSPDPKDARAKIVALTAKGQKERTEAGKAVSSAEQKIKRKLGPGKYEALRETLASISG
jgi:DNA-binding MarR family transcriptional regulator